MSATDSQHDGPPAALLRDPRGTGWLAFEQVTETLVAPTPAEVRGVLERAQQATDAGQWAAGYVGYEAAPAFDPALVVRASSPLPAAWFVVTDAPAVVAEQDLPRAGSFDIGGLHPTLTEAEHARGVRRIQDWISRGETYQVNFTHQLQSGFEGDPWGLFLSLWHNQRSDHAAWLDLGDQAICSASPELFFELDGERVVSRPMKGTAARGRSTTEDRFQAEELAESAKNRAENVMIVDMIRNDLARIAKPGSVSTCSLFDVERYPSVFQLTSTVEAQTEATVVEIFDALFPCASITGAPKINTTRLIHELEPHPRGVYTGAVGFMAPDRQARFNVAIRTATIDRRRGELSYGVGGGIVWDSEPEAEHRECLDKARVLTAPRPEFELLETLLWKPEAGYALLARHLSRLADSAEYFGFAFDRDAVHDSIVAAAAQWQDSRRVRLTLTENGDATVTSEPLAPFPSPMRLAVASSAVDSSDPFLFHKTTHRGIYDRARREHPAADDVLLWNERGELTETTLANVVVDIGGRRFTPPVSCGLLAGVQRGELLAGGEITERVIRLEELESSPVVHLVNSVRGWIAAELAPPPTG